MSHSAWLFCSLIISMVVILVLILKVKLNAAISLVLGSILMGLLSGISMVDTIEGINTGFGNMLKGMGLPIGFGIILGELVSASGGAKIIAHKIVKAFPKTKAIYAIGLAAFILAIPVYFDVTFVILIPIGVALMKEINKSIAHIVGAITIGAAAAHTMVPPTPAPLAAGEIFGFDTGIMIGFGTVFGLIGVFLVIFIYTKFLDKKTTFWNPALDESAQRIMGTSYCSESSFFWPVIASHFCAYYFNSSEYCNRKRYGGCSAVYFCLPGRQNYCSSCRSHSGIPYRGKMYGKRESRKNGYRFSLFSRYCIPYNRRGRSFFQYYNNYRCQ